MADDTRRSDRRTKGQTTKSRDLFDEPSTKTKTKTKPDKKAQGQAEPVRAQSAQSGDQQEEEEGDEDAIYRCVCGDQREIRGREMICCDKCEAWQHNKCLNLPDSSYWEDRTYLCEVCDPDAHRELLEAIERGEKPWNRKKGAKIIAPKYRPSWGAVSDATATPDKKATPTPQTTKAHAPASVAAPSPTATPTPAAAPKEAPRENLNGQADAKPSKKPSPKSQLQSPTGEKRPHDAIAEKDATQAKRRKSSVQHHEKGASPSTKKEASQTALAQNPDDLPDKQRLLVKKLVESLSATVKQASDSRGYRIPDGATPTSIATKLALQIDYATVTAYGAPTDNNSPYAIRVRSIMHNTKNNAILVDRLLNGSLSPAELASMPAEEMASEDKQKEYAAMREANEKQMVLTEETGPRLRKTHKGEELVGEDNEPIESESKPPEHRVRDTVEDGAAAAQSPRQDDGQTVELPEDVAARSALSLDTSAAPDSVRRPSTTFDINSVFDKVRSPQHDRQAFLHRRQSSIRAQQTPQQSAIDDADVDRLLKDEDNDVDMTGYSADPTIVWRGSINMQQSGPFDAVARFVAGGDFGQIVPWDQLLLSSLAIAGRIAHQRGNDYIQGLASTGSHDVAVLAISPVSTEGKRSFDQLFEYFHPRQRWGVVPVESFNNGMRDLYVIPIAGDDELPNFVNMLEYCTLETPRSENMVLLALVAKLPEAKPPSQHPEVYPAAEIAAGQVAQPAPLINGPIGGPANGPSPSPITNPHGPLFSPVQPAFPPAQHLGQPVAPLMQNGNSGPASIAHQYPNALEIFGPYIDAPVVQTVLQTPNMNEEQLRNLAHIMQKVPAARMDFNALSNALADGQAT